MSQCMYKGLRGNAQDLEKYDLQKWQPLLEEIRKLKTTLLKLDTDDTNATDYLIEHTQRIKEAVPTVPVTQVVAPIHQLLKVRPLKRIEIPLDILELLTTAGFDVNYREDGATCLHVAIRCSHHKAVRWLVEHGADCNSKFRYTQVTHEGYSESYENPLAMLMRYSNVPLDLVSLLNTPENVNDGM